MNEKEQRQLARKLIRNLLAHGPMKGATLKLRMLADFEAEANVSFDAAFRIYPKFVSFLASNDDLVEVIRPPVNSPGDITVRLRQPTEAVTAAVADWAPEASADFALRRDLWQAFTNPDVRRRRYFQKTSATVVHFVDDPLPARAVDSEDWVMIESIPAEIQSGWMRRFVETNFAPSSKQVELLHVATVPYTSALNHTFAFALGSHAAAWKRYRASQVFKAVRQWADAHGIALDALTRTPAPMSATEPETREALRESLLEVVKQASLEELRLIQVPASLLLSFSRSNAR